MVSRPATGAGTDAGLGFGPGLVLVHRWWYDLSRQLMVTHKRRKNAAEPAAFYERFWDDDAGMQLAARE